ncbi:hypothetical protein M1L60_27260 [Actinoplanes sp. TRM 88003]|uniref:Uncharacterized protein n=1 Tax=Paractinoplanes aksuensis TaxID=2939490 RepID=A0ABT1DTY5_9ACTN|nr:hypothetical protein [Actinoplanes aksuensis]MCO8274304.1 hypothetical protein [Actinoplanes aksuensis]
MLLNAEPVRVLGDADNPRLRFSSSPSEERSDPRRLLFVDDKPAFELSFWCGTCQILFQRQEGSTETFSAEGDDLIEAFGSLLPRGDYQPLQLEIRPRLVQPSRPGDYFAEEQVATWGLDSFWGLPVYPRTPYYRTFETAIDDNAHLYEFVVPMVPPSWNERAQVEKYASDLADGEVATAVAVSILDVSLPATDDGSDYYSHWALTHFLLDGHHRIQAAAESDRPIRLLSLLSVDHSLGAPSAVARVPALRAQPAQSRTPHPA